MPLVVQIEMTKICLLKADILQINLTSETLSIPSVDPIMEDLEDWYKELPNSMQIGNLVNESIPAPLRQSIYYVHLLYLGAIMLLYRQIAAKLANVQRLNPSTASLGPENSKLPRLMQEGVLAAKHSASILALLFAENGWVRGCWIIV
jgi:hypothetical protein